MYHRKNEPRIRTSLQKQSHNSLVPFQSSGVQRCLILDIHKIDSCPGLQKCLNRLTKAFLCCHHQRCETVLRSKSESLKK